MSRRADDIVAFIDAGLQTAMPDPTFGEVSPVNRDECWRCGAVPDSETGLCSPCRAYLLEDTDVDPKCRRTVRSPIETFALGEYRVVGRSFRFQVLREQWRIGDLLMSEDVSREEIAAQLVRLLADVESPDFQQRLAEREAQRTDPWRWYCRLCGAEGENSDRTVTWDEAMAHIAPGEPCGRGSRVGQAGSGRLLHVWTY